MLSLSSSVAQETDPEMHMDWMDPHRPHWNIVQISARPSSVWMDFISPKGWYKVPFLWCHQHYDSTCFGQSIFNSAGNI